jgi:hypothetical protein
MLSDKHPSSECGSSKEDGIEQGLRVDLSYDSCLEVRSCERFCVDIRVCWNLDLVDRSCCATSYTVGAHIIGKAVWDQRGDIRDANCNYRVVHIICPPIVVNGWPPHGP